MAIDFSYDQKIFSFLSSKNIFEISLAFDSLPDQKFIRDLETKRENRHCIANGIDRYEQIIKLVSNSV